MADYRKAAENIVNGLEETSQILVYEVYKILRRDVLKRNTLAILVGEDKYKIAETVADRLVNDGEYDWSISEKDNIFSQLNKISNKM